MTAVQSSGSFSRHFDSGGASPVVSLTFDDGPDRTWTPNVLAQLASLDVRATFFLVGERVLAHPEVVEATLAAGHEVQLHCHRHVRHTELNEAELLLDTGAALAALAGAGARPLLWRPPWGVRTAATDRVAERLGLRLVHWSIDTHDWRGDSPDEMLTRARPRLRGGGSVLMHDALGPGSLRSGCRNTVALLPALTAAVRAAGGELAPMPCRPSDPGARGTSLDENAEPPAAEGPEVRRVIAVPTPSGASA